MRIENTEGTPLNCLDDWKSIHKSTQWKQGRSAYSVANFIVKRDGARKLRDRVSSVLGSLVTFHKIIPEYEVKFDQYGKGRFHDLGIFGKTQSGKSLFVGVEAKVDEPFGTYVADEWRKAQEIRECGKGTRLPQRIMQLCDRFNDGLGTSECDKVRYQLLHGTAGTVDAKADVSVFYVAVFKTDCYDDAIGKSNRQDYQQFIERAGGVPTQDNGNGASSYVLTLGGKRLLAIYEYFDLR